MSKMPRGDYRFCASCKECDCDNIRKIDNQGKYACNYFHIRVYACDRPKNNRCFTPVASWNLSSREAAYDASLPYFYITTAIFEILGLGHNKDLQTLYLFRNNYLCDTNETSGFMSEYDIVGPVIARLLKASDNRVEMASFLYDVYIKGTLDLIYEEKLDEAAELYIAMYERLKRYFKIDEYMKAKEYSSSIKNNKKMTFLPISSNK